MNITSANIVEYEEASKAFDDNFEELCQMTRRYPIEVTFADCRKVFASKTEIATFIKRLNDKIKAYKETLNGK